MRDPQSGQPSRPQPPPLRKPRSLQQIVSEAKAHNQGARDWRFWKEEMLDQLVELVERSPRMFLEDADLRGDGHFAYRIIQPVPRWPRGDKLVIDHEAVFHLHYQEDWRWQSPPGWAPLGLFKPMDPFHPNMRPALRGAICLGALPAGTPAKELVLMGYYALTLQDANLSETDPQGVMNAQACEFFRSHSHYLPLTTAGLFDAWEPPQTPGVSMNQETEQPLADEQDETDDSAQQGD